MSKTFFSERILLTNRNVIPTFGTRSVLYSWWWWKNVKVFAKVLHIGDDLTFIVVVFGNRVLNYGGWWWWRRRRRWWWWWWWWGGGGNGGGWAGGVHYIHSEGLVVHLFICSIILLGIFMLLVYRCVVSVKMNVFTNSFICNIILLGRFIIDLPMYFICSWLYGRKKDE